jgi:hypothetical protein
VIALASCVGTSPAGDEAEEEGDVEGDDGDDGDDDCEEDDEDGEGDVVAAELGGGTAALELGALDGAGLFGDADAGDVVVECAAGAAGGLSPPPLRATMTAAITATEATAPPATIRRLRDWSRDD